MVLGSRPGPKAKTKNCLFRAHVCVFQFSNILLFFRHFRQSLIIQQIQHALPLACIMNDCPCFIKSASGFLMATSQCMLIVSWM